MESKTYIGELVSDLIGTPFVDGGRDIQRDHGLDCWGLVMEVQRRIGRDVPDYAASAFDPKGTDTHMREATGPGGPFRIVSSPVPGDIVCMNLEPRMPSLVDHFGVYIGRHKFIHLVEHHNCETSSLHDLRWERRLRGFGRWAG